MGIQEDMMQLEQEQRNDQRLSIDIGSTPDRSARILEMQMQTGLPVDLIDRNLDDLEKASKRASFDPEQFRKNSPVFAQWAAENPYHPSLIEDDYQKLSGIEWAVKAFSAAHESGWATVEQAKIASRFLHGKASPDDMARLEDLRERYPHSDFGAEHWYSRLITEAGRMLPNMEYTFLRGAETGLGGAVTGATAAAIAGQAGPQAATPEEVLTVPAAAAVGYGVGQVTGSFEAARELETGLMALELMDIRDEDGNEIPMSVVRGSAQMVGVINASLELVGLGAIGKHLGGEKLMRQISRDAVKEALTKPTFRQAMARFAGRYAESVGTEVVTEVLQESTNILAAEIAKGVSDGEFQGTTADEVANRLAEIAVRTLEGTAIIGGIGPSARLTSDVRRVQSANGRRDIFRALGKDASESTTRVNAPRKFREYVQRLRESGDIDSVRVPIDQFNEYFQSQNLDPARAAEEITGSQSAYIEASSAGTDIEISLEDFAEKVAPNHLDGLLDDLRLRPDDMTAREAREWSSNAESLLKELSGEEGSRTVSESVYDDVFGQLVQAGFDQSAAEQYATLTGSVFESLGSRTGIDPMELYQRYGLRIARERPAILNEVTDFDTEVDPLIDRLRSGDIPEATDEATTVLRTALDDLGRFLDEMDVDLSTTDNAAVRELLTAGETFHQVSKGESDVGAFKSGHPVRFRYAHNPESATESLGLPDKDSPFDRGFEPAGRYVVQISSDAESILETGTIEFQNPLVIETGEYGTDTSWKRVLSERYDGKTGKDLSEAIIADGHDGVVTIDGDHTSEILDLTTFESARALYQPDGDSQPRASITINEATRQVAINLNKAANLSSFLHESGHFYLEVLGDLAEATDAPQQIQDDYAAILKWMGVDNRHRIQREHHEKFARGFEAYLMEGNAPSVELQNAFARFKAWLVSIYRRLSALDVELSNPIRQVFDRLVASEDAIQNATESQNYVNLFSSAEQAGMTPEQFEVYRARVEQARIHAEESLTQNLLRIMNREQRKWWKERREEVREDVAARVHKMRVYRALSFLQNGTGPDGSPLDIEPLKLSKAELVDAYGKEFLKRLPRPYVYTVEGGVSMDEVAALFGYRSGDQMVKELVNVRHMKKLIEAETDARMEQLYPDPMLDGSITEQAMLTVHNNNRAELLAAELRTLKKLSRADSRAVSAAKRADAREQREARAANRGMLPNIDDLKLIKMAAERTIGEKRVRDINPNNYRVAEAKAARKAFEAAGKNDFQTAYAEKRKQILNHELYRAASKAKSESEKIRRYARKFDRRRVQERLGKAQDGIIEKILTILSEIDLRQISTAEADRNTAKRQMLQQIEEGSLLAPPSLVRKLEAAAPSHWKNLTMDELRGVRDVVRQLEHQARTEAEAVVLGEKRMIAAEVEKVAASIRDSNKPVSINLGSQTRDERRRRSLREVLMAWLRPSEIARQLDGGAEFGPTFRALIEPMRRAYAEKLIPMQTKMSEDIANIYRKHFTNKELQNLGKRIEIEELDGTMSHGDLLSLALNWGNAGNRDAILRSEVNGRPVFTELGVNKALGRLSERDWQFVQDIWNYLDSYWGELSALEKRRRGISPKKVESLPFEVMSSDGKRVKLSGGYYPLKYRSDLDPRQGGDDIEAEFKKFTQGKHVTANTRAGSTHDRVGSGGRPVQLGLNVIDQHLHEVTRDIAIGDAARFVMRILNHAEFKRAMHETGNQEAMQSLNLWLQDSAVGEMAARGFINRSSAYIRTGFTVSKLGLSATVTMLQLTGLPQTMVVVGQKAFAHGFGKWASNPLAAHKMIMEQSDFLRTRYQTSSWNKDVADTRAYLNAQFSSTPTRGKQVMNALAYAYFWPIARTQMVVDELTWMAGMWKAVNVEKLDGKDAISYADALVEKAQTSGFFTDRSGIERGTTDTFQQRQSQFVKLWTTLISYMLAKANIAYAQGRQFMRKPSLWGAVTLATDITMLFAVEAVLAGLIRGTWPDEDDDESWSWWLAKESASSAVAGIPFVREVPSAMYGGGNTPLGSLSHDIFRSMQQIEQGDVDAAMIKSFNNVGGTLFHYPSSQTNRAIDAYWRDNVEGEEVDWYEYILGNRDR